MLASYQCRRLLVDDEPEIVPPEQEQQNEEQELARVDVGRVRAPAGANPRDDPEYHQDPEQQTN
jgi:hypothetical protein